MILLPYRFCGDSHHAFAFPFVLIFLPLRLSCKESSTSNQAFSIVFTTPSVPLIGDRNLRRKDVTALLGAQNRYALRLADHQRSSPWLCGMGPPGDKIFIVIMHSVFIGIVFYCLQIGNFIFMAYRIISYVYKFRITETYIEALKNCSCFF